MSIPTGDSLRACRVAYKDVVLLLTYCPDCCALLPMTAALDGVPIDEFRIRLAVVRATMGWNFDQAARATGIGSETWRTWEKGTRRCTDIVAAADRIAHATGLSRQWLIMGGPLATPPPTGIPERNSQIACSVKTAGRWPAICEDPSPDLLRELVAGPRHLWLVPALSGAGDETITGAEIDAPLRRSA